MSRAGETVEATWIPVHEPSVWLRTAIETLRQIQTANGSRLTACPHVVDCCAVDLVTWLYWPYLVTCANCVHLVPEPDEDERWRCDRCGACNVGACSSMLARPLPGVAVCFGLCDSCRRKETGS